jgi:hypothetical protein
MATKTTGRISGKPTEFAPYMQSTDKLQLSAGTPIIVSGVSTPQTKWQNWGWTLAQSQQWTSFRNQSDLLFPQWSDKNHNNTDTTDQMGLLIKNVKKYDNDPLTGFHLLDRVALSGTISDCETFHVKRGTALAVVSHQGSATARSVGGVAVGTGASSLKPVLSIKKYDVGEHIVSVVNPETPKSSALPDGIKFAKLYRFIGTAAPTAISQYTFVANAKKGKALSSFADADLAAFAAGTVVYAWYIARYESNKGVLGDACGAIHAQILHP